MSHSPLMGIFSTVFLSWTTWFSLSFIISFLDPCLNDTPSTLHFVYISTT